MKNKNRYIKIFIHIKLYLKKYIYIITYETLTPEI